MLIVHLQLSKNEGIVSLELCQELVNAYVEGNTEQSMATTTYPDLAKAIQEAFTKSVSRGDLWLVYPLLLPYFSRLRNAITLFYHFRKIKIAANG